MSDILLRICKICD